MKNSEIRQAIKESRYCHYEIAALIGISEYTFCKWFRKELSEEQKRKVYAAIADLQKSNANDK